ncbi:MAG: TetR/AcrR family transcriptional regulator [Clostridiales bacterium]|nr:TetR/AcrR family transcriptional regulator [Clostridiales bacterium]
MTPSTKLALANSLRRLLQKKFLDDITVKEIVEDCEVNRQTFYYHFQDIYDLLHWSLEHETAEVLQPCTSWQEALMTTFRYIQENHVIIYHIYRSSGREHLDCQFFTMSRALTTRLLDAAAEGLVLSERDREFLMDFYMYALAGTMLGWLADDMKEEPSELAARISFLLEDEFRRVAQRFSSSGSPS